MSREILLSDEDYRALRVESREALHRAGIASNPGFTNGNIIDGLARALGVPVTIPETMEQSEYSGEFFRDTLGEVLGLELPPSVVDVINGLRSIR